MMLGETSLVPRLLELLVVTRISVLPVPRIELRLVDPDIKRMSAAMAMMLVPCDLWDESEADMTGTPLTRSNTLIDRNSLLR